MKKSFLAVCMALTSSSLLAANYYVVVPVKGRMDPTQPTIAIQLNAYKFPSGIVGVPYPVFDLNTLLSITGDATYLGSGAIWRVQQGTLPAGLSLSTAGQLSGTPTAVSSSDFELKATYKSKMGQQAYRVVVADLAISLSAATLPSGAAGSAFSYDFKPLVSVIGDPSYAANKVVWQLASGTLPCGMGFDSATGMLTGTPCQPSKSSISVKATYSAHSSVNSYQLAIGADYGLFNNGEGVSADRISVSTSKYGRVTVGKPISSGKHYLELVSKGLRHEVGLTSKPTSDSLSVDSVFPLENKDDALAAYLTSVQQNVFLYNNSAAGTKIGGPYSACPDTNCTVGLAIDADHNTITWFGPNGPLGSYTVGLPKPWYVTVARGNRNPEGALNATINTGQAPFVYSVPAGHSPGLW